MAWGAHKAIIENGLSIPEDISLIGYGNITMEDQLYIPLTTVKQNSYKIGELACKSLMDKISDSTGKDKIYKKALVSTELIIRETTALLS